MEGANRENDAGLPPATTPQPQFSDKEIEELLEGVFDVPNPSSATPPPTLRTSTCVTTTTSTTTTATPAPESQVVAQANRPLDELDDILRQRDALRGENAFLKRRLTTYMLEAEHLAAQLERERAPSTRRPRRFGAWLFD